MSHIHGSLPTIGGGVAQVHTGPGLVVLTLLGADGRECSVDLLTDDACWYARMICDAAAQAVALASEVPA